MNIIAISNNLYDKTSLCKKNNIVYIKSKDELTYETMMFHNPEYIFFPHWSYIIPKKIYANFNCIIFHMTDLPFGRGGSPLQNLLERKIYKTKISAIQCDKILDSGDVYLKRDFDISYGNAENIYIRAADIVSNMIDEIILNHPKPIPQTGEAVVFKRRNAAQSDISELNDLEAIYNYIRMLDAPGYPKAFIKINDMKYTFCDARMVNGKLQTKVEIEHE